MFDGPTSGRIDFDAPLVAFDLSSVRDEDGLGIPSHLRRRLRPALPLFLSLWVVFYEEPALREQFGEEYETYRRGVPGWWPRLRPWKAG
jgi:hypothetical protein